MWRPWISLLLAAAFSSGGYAQVPAETQQTIESLRREIAVMSDRLRMMEEKLANLEAKSSSAAVPGREESAAKEKPSEEKPAPPPAQGAPVSARVVDYQTASEDQAPAPRLDNTPLDPTYRDYFRLPTTNTWLQIGGYVKTDFIYDLDPAGEPDSFVPSSIPVNPRAQVRDVNLHARQTRFNFDFRTPVGERSARTFIEFDFFGSNGPTTPRLRHLYGQFRNVVIGLTDSNFADPDVLPDTLDFAGPSGAVKIKNPQIRYSFILSKRSTISFSVEKPTSDILSRRPDLPVDPNSPAPDLSARWRYEANRGHLQVASLYRWIAATVGEFSTKRVFGWGLSASSGFRTVGRNNFVLQTTFGKGIGRYLVDASGQGVDASLDSPDNPATEALPTFGIAAGYQHYWRRHVRSNAVFGYVAVENTQLQTTDFFHRSQYAAANLMWTPFRHVEFGAEVLYGWQELKNGARGNATRIQLSTKYRFLSHEE